MLRSITDRVNSFRAESARFASSAPAPSSSSSSRSARWQDDTGLRSWTNAPREANERRDLAASKLVSASAKSTVRLENLGLTELPPEQHFASLDRATSLSLAGNNLTAIASAVLGLRNLRHLNVSRNLLGELPPGIGQLTNLRTLDASHTGLEWVPFEIGRLPKLKALDLSNNALRSLPAEIGDLPKLKTLKLNGNLLRQRDETPNFEEPPLSPGEQRPGLPPEIGNLKKLRELDLSSNRFQRVPEEIGRLRELRTLKFQHNALTDNANANAIPESVTNLKKLTSFDVSDNPALGYLPRDFGPLEYSSKRKLELTQLRPKTGAMAFLARKFSMPRQSSDAQAAADITIHVKNTAIPLDMAPDRLPSLTGTDTPPPLESKDLYVPPNYSRPRENVQPPPAPHEGFLGEQSRGLMPQQFPPAMTAMMPPVLQSVLPYGGVHPHAIAGGVHPIQSLLQQVGEQVALSREQLAPPSVPTQNIQEPVRPESPGAQSDCSTDSFASTTEEFVPARRSESATRRRHSTQADASSNGTPSRSNGSRRLNTPVPTQVFPMQPPVTYSGGSTQQQPSGDPVAPRVSVAPMMHPAVLQQLSQQFVAGQGSYPGVNPSMAHTLAPNVALAGAGLIPPQFAATQLPGFDGAGSGNYAGGIHPQQQQTAMPYVAPFASGTVQPNLFGMQPHGFGANSAIQNPMFAGLLGKIAAGTAQSAYPRPLFGLPQNAVQGRNSRFDHSTPQLVSPAQAAFDRRGIASIQATRLIGLSKSRPLELKGKALEHCVEEAKQGRLFGQTTGMPRAQILWSLGLMIHRQQFINGLAKEVAVSNADRKKNSPDPMDAFLIDDPKQIAVVYQTLASKELGIHGFDDWRSKLDNDDEEYKGIFGMVVAPPNFDNLRQQLIDALFEDEAQSGGAEVANFVESQGFWKQFQNELIQAEKTSNQTMFGY